jgi:Fe-S-cluster containining protein
MPRACKRCGQCCSKFYLHIKFSKEDKTVDDLFQNSFKNVRDGHILSKMVLPIEPHPDGKGWFCTCKNYIAPMRSNGNKAQCKIHSTRPRMCRDFPYGRAGQYPGCGYKGRKKSD